VCCLNRPFDDLSQARVRLEASAVLSIIERCKDEEWTLVSSSVITIEVSKIQNPRKHKQVLELCGLANEVLLVNDDVEKMSFLYRNAGIKPFDSLHLALAEHYAVDVFLTSDDKLLRLAKSQRPKIKVSNPAVWLMEVTQNEY
jgi:predicted nucleic acid-binding protein